MTEGNKRYVLLIMFIKKKKILAFFIARLIHPSLLSQVNDFNHFYKTLLED